MNGLLRRLTRRRAAPADEHPPGPPAASEPADATVISLEEEAPLSEEERALQAREEELRRQRRDLPAGVDPHRLETAASEGARRGALRRRVRYLHSTREILLRDLGGFYYEVHRAGTQHGGHRDILETKAGRLAAIDHELRELEARLGEPYSGQTVVREPGIGGTCPTCGELHASDAGWCWQCGTPLTERARGLAEDEVDREIAARERREAERVQAAATPPGETTDASTAELAARVREATARDDVDARGDAPTGELPAGRDEAAGGGDRETRGGEQARADEDAITQGERRR
jgi:hypothetical protein